MRSYGYLFITIILLAGCRTYEPSPLNPRELFEEVDQARHLLETGAKQEDGEPFTFRRAAALMNVHSPALREVVAEYETVLAPAEISTPWPNPTLELGPKTATGLDDGNKTIGLGVVTLGFAIPISGRLGKENDFNRKSAYLAFLRVLARHRELYLDLREAYSQWSLAKIKVNAGRNIVNSVEKALGLTRKLVDAGVSGALDVGQMELELHAARVELLEAERELAESEVALSRLIGVHPDGFGPAPEGVLPEPPEILPPLENLKALMIRNHPGMALLREEYEVAESKLAFEIIKQYPDLGLGGTYESEPGEEAIKIYELTVGFDLPIFDRNQQAIAEAHRLREEIREKYMARANIALAQLEGSLKIYELLYEKQQRLETEALPRARSNVELARRSVAAALIDSLQYLAVERGMNAALIDTVKGDLELRSALIDIEKAVGRPIFLFPFEEEGAIPPLPDNLDRPTRGADTPVDELHMELTS
jgi:cobalt-zinc-cadmium efflux system outer membrane protein